MEELRTIKISDASKQLEMPEQTLRQGLQQGVFPFGVAIKMEKNFSYYIFRKRLELYLKGEL
ncbi:hypothetical protein [Helcococcus kunzii]|uniref:hypothetical protein n=1 Tax=Helcococcus kunzii TaxID=40091 RepID=UPI0038A2EB1F